MKKRIAHVFNSYSLVNCLKFLSDCSFENFNILNFKILSCLSLNRCFQIVGQFMRFRLIIKFVISILTEVEYVFENLLEPMRKSMK